MPKDHFLPQFYLNGFTDPHTPEGHDPFAWVYSFDRRAWEKRAPKNVAVESGYYDITDEHGRVKRHFDLALQVAEDVAARLMRGKVLKRRLLTARERVSFAAFVALMHVRVPRQHEDLERALSEVGRKIAIEHHRALVRDPRLLEVLKEQVRRKTGKSHADVTPETLDPRNFKIIPNKQFVQAAALQVALDEGFLIWRMGWTIWVSEPPNYFITSDHPYALVDPMRPKMRPVLRSSPTVELTLPLSRTVAIVAEWGSDGMTSRSASPKIVEQINIRTARYASRFLLAPKPSFPGWDWLRERLQQATVSSSTP